MPSSSKTSTFPVEPATLSEETYRKCWAILVQHAGAAAEDEGDFLRTVHQHPHFIEYRFFGVFGYGGKFWHYLGQLYISCYPEDATPERVTLIEKVNELLAEVLNGEATNDIP